MAIYKCKMCGGDLNIEADINVIECEYCGTTQTVPTADNEKKVNLFNRANRLRLNSEFDKAAGIYESIIAEFPEEAEAYWGLCLCNYGIEYVDDPATAKKVPTCHRASFEKLANDENFNMAMEYADVVAQKVYRDEAGEIDCIMDNILSISKNEKPYDVFICYKETDEKGERTIDSVLAQDVYDALTAKGMKVFFARITLEDKLGQMYEPYIFAALNSAKVMLSIGTKYEYFQAVWVKNEWSRFLKLMAKDKSKVLVPCYKDMDAYDLPDEFKALQAQDMGKIGFMQDLTRGIEKIVGVNTAPVTEKVVINQSGGLNVDALLKRGNIALEDELFNEAKTHFDKVLNIDAECAEAYLGLAMAEEKVGTLKEFIYKNNLNSKNYLRAKQYADSELVEKLNKLEAEKNEYLAELERKRQETEKRLEEKRNKIKPVQNNICTTPSHSIALKSDGTVLAVGYNRFGQCNVDTWTDIIAVSASFNHTVGIKSDGTVVAVGDNKERKCNVSNWKDIIAVSAGSFVTVGLRSDGTVVATKYNNHNYNEICNLADWKNIVAISAGVDNVMGLKSDGTVVVALSTDNLYDFSNEKNNARKWKDIVAIVAQNDFTVGLKSDGTVVIATRYTSQYDVSNWTDIVAISSTDYHIVGLKADGTVVAVGDNDDGQCNVNDWTDIIAISAGDNNTIGLKSDGSVVSTAFIGDEEYYCGQCGAEGWKLFDDFNNLEEERRFKVATKKRIDAELLVEKERLAEQRRIEEERIAEEKRLEKERLYEEKRLEAIRLAEEERIAEAERKKRDKKIAVVVSVIGCVICAIVFIFGFIVIPNGKYNDAIELMNSGKYIEAYEAFLSMDGYKDSIEKAESIYGEYKIAKAKIATVGEYVTFGAYEQDGDEANGKEEVEWLVLDKQGDRLLLISKKALDVQKFHTEKTDITWEKSSLRKWLNSDFIGAAFDEEEKAKIPTVEVPAHKNPDSDCDPGNPTQDNVFILSADESEKYFENMEDRTCVATNYAYKVVYGELPSRETKCHNWLRTPGPYQDTTAFVASDGAIVGTGKYVLPTIDGAQIVASDVDSESIAVRPAMWIEVG